ncbi:MULTISPECIES: hypothetical protein [Arthrobacter]|uniref:Tetratricopeptide repeat-containing protein n=2 Tax=Arthrobacter TaxID=1663 RepID=A0ABU9KLH2_9MICC|nr:hypothetical protein [Arthrobacter sp. YJM1]MDP5226796.1 hypothetical protein [Arthrobacter sp. YJM1]
MAPSPPIHQDARDITPFVGVVFQVSVRKLASGLGERVRASRGLDPVHRFSFREGPGRLPGFSSKFAKALHAELTAGGGPERFLRLAHGHSGFAGLCFVLAGLRAYQGRQYPQAAELLRRGRETLVDDAAHRFMERHLMGLVVEVELGDGVAARILYSDEALRYATAHALREIGDLPAAVVQLDAVPSSPAKALALAHLAGLREDYASVIGLSEGVRNGEDLSAGLLLLRARAQRQTGRLTDAQSTLGEIQRRKGTALQLRNAALTEQALLMLDGGVKSLRRGGIKRVEAKQRATERKAEREAHREFDTTMKRLSRRKRGGDG